MSKAAPAPAPAAKPDAPVAETSTPTPTPEQELTVKSQAKIQWEEPKDALPTTRPPTNWKIETFRENKYDVQHTLKDGTVITISVVPFLLTPSNLNMVYFLEPGYSPDTGVNHNLAMSVANQNNHIDKTIEDMKAITEQLEKLREFLIE